MLNRHHQYILLDKENIHHHMFDMQLYLLLIIFWDFRYDCDVISEEAKSKIINP